MCKIPGDHGSNCQTALYFFESHIKPLWNSFKESCKTKESISEFPFKEFFSDFSTLFHQKTFENAFKVVEEWFDEIVDLFHQIKHIQGLELFRSDKSRCDYLTCFQSRIIGVTASYAAVHRNALLDLGFQYDTVIMHESHKIMEIQGFLSLTCQPFSSDTGKNLLKRVVMIGDKDSLAVPVSNTVLLQYSNLDQSLYHRLIRNGIKVIELECQGLYKPSLYSLLEWNSSTEIQSLADLPCFEKANPGFCFDYQFINVLDYLGHGEMEPRPLFYQNLGEAEYAVAIYQYMRLLGYI